MNIKAKVKILIAVALCGAMLLLAYEVFYWATHVYESDARVQTDFTNISAQVDGKIETVHVAEGSPVRKGQLIVTLEHEDIRLNIRSLQTDLALERANRTRLMSERVAFEDEFHSKLETQREKIAALEVEYQSEEQRLSLARKDLARMRGLVRKRISPETKLAIEQDKTLILEGRTATLKGKIAIAKRELAQIKSTEKRLEIIDNQISISKIKENRILDSIKKEELFIEYRKISSPIDGVIGKIHRYKGEYVEDGVNILMLYDPKLYWVEAYVNESQIRHVRIGQEVLINLDAYPFEDFFGKVHHIGSVTTNGSDGNNGRTSKLGSAAERVPVRISLENPPPNLTPGMRADINVRIYKNIKLW